MTKTGLARLLQVLMDDYGVLKGQLARRLGSPDVADDVLQEVYLRLQQMKSESVRHPRTYLYRVALNIAADRRRSDQRRLARSEVELLLQVERDELDPERIAAARSSIRTLVQALEELPPRQRAMLIAVRVESLTYAQAASRFAVSTRYIEREVKQALDYCRRRLETNPTLRYAHRPPRTSNE